MPYYQMHEVDPREHEHFMEWWTKNGKPSPIPQAATPEKPCQMCRQTVTHNMSAVFNEETGRLFGFMCESGAPFPMKGDA